MFKFSFLQQKHTSLPHGRPGGLVSLDSFFFFFVCIASQLHITVWRLLKRGKRCLNHFYLIVKINVSTKQKSLQPQYFEVLQFCWCEKAFLFLVFKVVLHLCFISKEAWTKQFLINAKCCFASLYWMTSEILQLHIKSVEKQLSVKSMCKHFSYKAKIQGNVSGICFSL